MKNVLFVILLLPNVLFAQTDSFIVDALVFPKKQERTITVGGISSDIDGYSNEAIQVAVDALPSEGGIVKLSTGKFIIKAPVRLKSNVKLIGSGPETILKRIDGYHSKFIIDADFGELKLTVEDASGFDVGMSIQVTDDPNSSAGLSGKPEWQPMLRYVADLHRISSHPAIYPFNYEWEEIGPGYHYGPAFGHWDIIHQSLDVLNFYPEHALHQLLNNIKNQEPNELIPGAIWMPGLPSGRDSVSWSKSDQGHPPLWPIAVQDYLDLTSAKSYLADFFSALVRQITWFENSRKAENEGFYYNDILLRKWESGVDEGIRFDNTGMGKWACIDATSHVFLLYHYAALWANELGIDSVFFNRRESELLKFIQNQLYAPDDASFYDIWAIKDTSLRSKAYENLWPLIVGAATNEQANKLIDLYVLNSSVFLTNHPLSTVGINDPKFELRMWRGPAWNSMTYWVARGCLKYGRKDAAKILLGKALDDSARQFEITGTIWEFYHPSGGSPYDVQRKPQTKRNMPCKDYLGHNPLIAMAVMFDKIK